MPRWKSQSGTVKQSLVKNGMIAQDSTSRKYILTAEGVAAAKEADAQSKAPRPAAHDESDTEMTHEPALANPETTPVLLHA